MTADDNSEQEKPAMTMREIREALGHNVAPQAPTEYRGIEIPEPIRRKWDDVEGLGWRMGVDSTLDKN